MFYLYLNVYLLTVDICNVVLKHVFSGESLTIYNVGIAAAGKYECVALNSHGQDTKRFHINVNGRYYS